MTDRQSNFGDEAEVDASVLMDDAPTSAPVTTATIAGKTFVSGLFW